MIERMKRLKRELMYKGSILDIYKDTMEFANGKQEEWDFVSHRMGAAAILPVLPDGRIVMVRQYRNALERETLEIPAGARDSKTEDTNVYLATDLEKGKQHLDDAESIDIEIYTLDELCQMIYSGELQDSKTVAAIMAYSNKVKG